MKKGLFTLCVIIASLVILKATPVYAVPDTTAPTIKNFEISSKTVNAPSSVELTIEVSDDISGVGFVRVWYYNPSKTKQYCAYFSNESGNTWKGTLEIDQYAESGVFTLWEIICEDIAGNYIDIYDDKLPDKYASKTITVTNKGGTDLTPPEIISYNVVHDTVCANSGAELELKLKDDNSGIGYAKVFYYNPSKTKQYCAYFYNEDEDGIWRGVLNFDEYVEIGTYTLWEFIIEDNAGNCLDLYDMYDIKKLPTEYVQKTITVLSDAEIKQYGKPKFKWSKDKQKCEAVFTADGKSIKMLANISTDTKWPTIFEKGAEIYTATVGAYSDTIEDAIAKLRAYVSLQSDQITIKKGKKTTLTIVSYEYGDTVKKWKSSDKKIVTVDKKGKIKAKKKGTATITVIMKSGAKATCTVTVK